ncbi:MAG: cobyrinate a,c-diamide synthase [Nitrospirae bacterium]|nr:cobyrinate a,c-diamide synthase [Nitrospirota bacterium]
MKGVVIAGTHSGCGKTTVTLGLLAALREKGLEVQPFKAGPDFIDTGLHRLITGRPSRNLDLWMCGKESVTEGFKRHSTHADIAVIEGVMGMYDGEYSTATLASTLGVPAILVVDAYGLAESAGAIVKGFASYGVKDEDTEKEKSVSLIAGVIFNRVASESHFRRLKDSVQDIPVLGYLPRDLNFEIPHRHLGLVVAEEAPIAPDGIERLATAVLQHVDIDEFIRIAGQCNEGYVSSAQTLRLDSSNGSFATVAKFSPSGFSFAPDCHPEKSETFRGPCARSLAENCYQDSAIRSRDISFIAQSPVIKIAVAYDKAFCFYYEDNLDLLRQAGIQLIFFSPLSDSQIPADADAVYIGGGYPEVYAEALSANASMLASVNTWAVSGKPVYAECGGLMYLSQGIHDFDENFFKMAGVFPFETRMRKGRSYLGYREIMLASDCILGKEGERVRGHEFHYSEIVDAPGSRSLEPERIYSVRDRSGEKLQDEGYGVKRTLASYVHLHFAGNRAIADNLIKYIKEK